MSYILAASARGGLRIKTAPLAILVESTRAPSDALGRVALALARAIADDAGAAGAAPSSERARPAADS